MDTRPAPDNFRIWSTALAVASAVLALLYSTGTLEIFTAAVGAFMQDSGMPSPWSERVFKMVFEGVKRWRGCTAAKKPGVEAEHIAGMAK